MQPLSALIFLSDELFSQIKIKINSTDPVDTFYFKKHKDILKIGWEIGKYISGSLNDPRGNALIPQPTWYRDC